MPLRKLCSCHSGITELRSAACTTIQDRLPPPPPPTASANAPCGFRATFSELILVRRPFGSTPLVTFLFREGMKMPGLRMWLWFTIFLSPAALAQDAGVWRQPGRAHGGTKSSQRAADLVARMSLEEKAAQVHHAAPSIPRLDVPDYNWWSEGLHGVTRARQRCFPRRSDLPRPGMWRWCKR